MSDVLEEPLVERVAVIGMAGRFPGAGSVAELWRNLAGGVESVVALSDEDLAAAGVDPAVAAAPDYVRRAAPLEDTESFDAGFFGYTPREAEILDPQQRLFLESCWEALEDAGYNPRTGPGRIGVFGGASLSQYLLFHLLPRLAAGGALAGLENQVLHGNDKDHLTSRVSYELHLTGPCVNVQSTCSTSLVAVHLACQSLLTYESDIVLAGGVSVRLPQRAGFLYQEGGILSPDGRCRAFDAQARGTVFGSGVGVVVLKRLREALADGDEIRAVVLGSAINHDGAAKAGYTAPGVSGQAAAVREALDVAGADPESIGYVEAHGTGTPLGDPIEIAALSEAFGVAGGRRQTCAIGSVKTNVGHLNAAAGVTGLIKTVKALEEGQIPPSLHFDQPNPQIDFAGGPFFVNTELRPWPADGPRRAGVSSFGIGGTNAHVVLEEPPPREAGSPSRPWQLLVLSARGDLALERATDRLRGYLEEHPEAPLADVAFTLQAGRVGFEHRRIAVCRDTAEALAALAGREPGKMATRYQEPVHRPAAFLFPGQGTQHPGMAGEVYRTEPAFRAAVDRCAELARPALGFDLRDLLVPGRLPQEEAAHRLERTSAVQAALFSFEYALAQLWMEWGVKPQALLGHSLGEYVAACLAGVFRLEDALTVIARRGELMDRLPPGAMLSVPLPEAEIASWLGPSAGLAAVNGPDRCTLSGPVEEMEELTVRLAARGIEGRRLATRHAFHSPMVEPILDAFAEAVARVPASAPEIPFLSNVTGDWITAAQATSPEYWARHLRATVRFQEGLAALLADPARLLVEVGPGETLSRLARRHPGTTPEHAVVASLPRPGAGEPLAALLEALGRVWLAGGPVSWEGFAAHERRRRIALPAYPFERRRYWIEPPGRATAVPEAAETLARQPAAEAPERRRVSTPFVPPGNELEERVADLFRELLGIAEVGIHDDFFELGGDSLLATQVAARLRSTFGVPVPMERLLDRPTVARIAEVTEELLLDELETMSEAEVRRMM